MQTQTLRLATSKSGIKSHREKGLFPTHWISKTTCGEGKLWVYLVLNRWHSARPTQHNC